MKHTSLLTSALTMAALTAAQFAWAGQAPGSSSDPDIPVSHHDRVYAAEQFSPGHRCDPGWQADMIYAQGCGQDPGVRRAAAIRADQDTRHGPDYEPCEHRA